MALSILLLAAFGLLVGLAARTVFGEPPGLWEACGVGIAGALVGGLVARGVGWMNTPGSAMGFVVAFAAAVTLLVVARGVHRPI